ncbi:MAG: hypothetical protein MJ086_03150 [Lachnospiraceae bacterium]|nr:hypothetical protein [Lachnospiraceae bacterium]
MVYVKTVVDAKFIQRVFFHFYQERAEDFFAGLVEDGEQNTRGAHVAGHYGQVGHETPEGLVQHRFDAVAVCVDFVQSDFRCFRIHFFYVD